MDQQLQRQLRPFSEKYREHPVIKCVPNRTLILIHRANDAVRQLKGYIAPVSELTAPGKGKGSAMAFNRLIRLVLKIQSKEKPLWLLITRLPQDCSHLKFNSV